MPRIPRPVMERLLARVEIDTSTGCWLFTGATSVGYGAIGLGGRADGVDFTHRVMYRHVHGSIPDGLHIDHLCRVRRCCNPDHLEAVTQLVNNRRAWAVRPTATHCKRGHEYTPDNTLQTQKQRYCRACIAMRNQRRSA